MKPSHTCLGCGADLAGVRAQRDDDLGLALVRCACGWAAVRRRRARGVARARLAAVLLLVSQGLIGGLLLWACVASAAAAAESMASLGAVGHVHELVTRRNPRSGDAIGRIWLEENWPVFIAPGLAGAWLVLGLGHLNRRAAAWRIPAWLAANAALLVALWAWPLAEARWRGDSAGLVWGDLTLALEMAVLALPLLVIWQALEPRLRASFRARRSRRRLTLYKRIRRRRSHA